MKCQWRLSSFLCEYNLYQSYRCWHKNRKMTIFTQANIEILAITIPPARSSISSPNVVFICDWCDTEKRCTKIKELTQFLMSDWPLKSEPVQKQTCKQKEWEFDLSQMSFMSVVVLQALPYWLAHFAGFSSPLWEYFPVKIYKITFKSFYKSVCYTITNNNQNLVPNFLGSTKDPQQISQGQPHIFFPLFYSIQSHTLSYFFY